MVASLKIDTDEQFLIRLLVEKYPDLMTDLLDMHGVSIINTLRGIHGKKGIRPVKHIFTRRKRDKTKKKIYKGIRKRDGTIIDVEMMD